VQIINGDDHASAAFRFCVTHDLMHQNHLRIVMSKIKEEIDKLPEDERPKKRSRRPERTKTPNERFQRAKEFLNETVVDFVRAGEELTRMIEEFQDHHLNSDEFVELTKEDFKNDLGPINLLIDVMKRAKKPILDEAKTREENEKQVLMQKKLLKELERKRVLVNEAEESFRELIDETFEKPKRERIERVGKLPPIAKMEMKVDGKKKDLVVFQDQDAATAAFEWSVFNDVKETRKAVDILSNLLKSTSANVNAWTDVMKKNQENYVDQYYGKKAASVDEAMKMWSDGTDKFAIISGSRLLEYVLLLKEKIADGDVSVEQEYSKQEKLLERSMKYYAAALDFETAIKRNKCKDALAFSKIMTSLDLKRPSNVLHKLIVAKCKFQTKKYDEAATDAFSILSRIPTTGDWKTTDIKYLTVYVGGSAAMKLGDFERALKFYAVCVRNDPEFKACKNIYKSLNAMKKSMKVCDDKLNDKHPRPALEAIEQVEIAAKSLGLIKIESFVNDLNVRKCRAATFKRQLNDAYDLCQTATDFFANKAQIVVDSNNSNNNDAETALLKEQVTADDMLKYAEALRAQAELFVADENPKDAKSLAEQALEICKENSGQSQWSRALLDSLNAFVRELHGLVRQYENNRDYAKILGVPPNLNELDNDRQCEFIKKSFKKLALKWHPDKHETSAGKTRAARKLNDAAEARDALNDRANCGGAGAVNRERARADKVKQDEQNRRNWQGYHQQQQRGGHHWGGGRGGQHWEF
jgi:tetratricopeptide (TPR) repeat protein